MKIILMIVLGCFFFNCNFENTLAQIPTVGIVPFDNRYNNEDEQILSQIVNSFKTWGRFNIVERVQLNQVISQMVEKVKSNPELYADDMGKLIGAKYFAIGGLLSKESFFQPKGLQLDQYTLRLAFVDVETNYLLANIVVDDFSVVEQYTPSEVPEIAEDWIEDYLQKLFPISAYPVKILEYEDNGQPKTLLIDQGTDIGIKEGQTLYLFKQEKIGNVNRYNNIGEGEVSLIEGKDFSQVEIEELKEAIEVNDIRPDPTVNPYIFISEKVIQAPQKLPPLLISLEILLPNVEGWMNQIAEAAFQEGILNSGYWSIIDRDLLYKVLSEQNLNLKGLTISSVNEGKISATKNLAKLRVSSLNFKHMGEENFKCIVGATYELIDIETAESRYAGTLNIGESSFHTSTTGKATALAKTFRVMGEEVAKALFSNVSPSSSAIAIEKVNDDGEIEKVWLNIGTAEGLKEGMSGQIKMKTKFAGKIIEKDAGEFIIISCSDPDLSLIEINPLSEFIFNNQSDFLGDNPKYIFRVSR